MRGMFLFCSAVPAISRDMKLSVGFGTGRHLGDDVVVHSPHECAPIGVKFADPLRNYLLHKTFWFQSLQLSDFFTFLCFCRNTLLVYV